MPVKGWIYYEERGRRVKNKNAGNLSLRLRVSKNYIFVTTTQGLSPENPLSEGSGALPPRPPQGILSLDLVFSPQKSTLTLRFSGPPCASRTKRKNIVYTWIFKSLNPYPHACAEGTKGGTGLPKSPELKRRLFGISCGVIFNEKRSFSTLLAAEKDFFDSLVKG